MTEAFTAGSASKELSREASVLEAKHLDVPLSMNLHCPSHSTDGAPMHGKLQDGTTPDGAGLQRRVLHGSRALEPGVIQRCVLESGLGSKEYVSAYTAGRGAE